MFRPGSFDSDSEELTKVIKSLIELNLMRERIQETGDLGVHSAVIGTLFSHVADDACQYVSQLKKDGLQKINNNQYPTELQCHLYTSGLLLTQQSLKLYVPCAYIYNFDEIY